MQVLKFCCFSAINIIYFKNESNIHKNFYIMCAKTFHLHDSYTLSDWESCTLHRVYYLPEIQQSHGLYSVMLFNTRLEARVKMIR